MCYVVFYTEQDYMNPSLKPVHWTIAGRFYKLKEAKEEYKRLSSFKDIKEVRIYKEI